MQLVLSNNRVIAHGENFIAMGGVVINTETGAKYENATVAECDNCPSDIDSVGYEYVGGIFKPCAPFGKGNNNGYFMEVCESCATPRNSGIPIKEGINFEHLHADVKDEISGKVSKTGDTLTGHLIFENTDNYYSVEKIRTVDGVNHKLTLGIAARGATTIEHYSGEKIDGRIELSGDGLVWMSSPGSVQHKFYNSDYKPVVSGSFSPGMSSDGESYFVELGFTPSWVLVMPKDARYINNATNSQFGLAIKDSSVTGKYSGTVINIVTNGFNVYYDSGDAINMNYTEHYIAGR